MIVDTHTHVVAPDREAYPLSPRPLSGPWYDEAPCSAPELAELMNEAGVDRAVLVQGVGAYSFDNRYVADAAAGAPERFTAACCVDPEGADPVAELSRWLARDEVEGVRLFALASRGRSWLADPPGRALWECAERHGAHVIVTLFARQLPELREALERFPAVPVSLDHCAFPDVNDPEPLLALADLPNLHLKVTTHVLDAARRVDGSPAPFAERLVARFGAERVMWGSDFCQTHDRPYGELVTLAQEAFAGLPAEARAACLGRTAERLWPGLAPPR